jgi:hypothetical protein
VQFVSAAAPAGRERRWRAGERVCAACVEGARSTDKCQRAPPHELRKVACGASPPRSTPGCVCAACASGGASVPPRSRLVCSDAQFRFWSLLARSVWSSMFDATVARTRCCNWLLAAPAGVRGRQLALTLGGGLLILRGVASSEGPSESSLLCAVHAAEHAAPARKLWR